MGGPCSTNGGEEERVLVGEPERKIPLGRPRRRWVDIRMDLGKLSSGLASSGLSSSAQLHRVSYLLS
jgi:hypothetical protein